MEFPIGIGDFWGIPRELHDKVCEELEGDESD